MKKERIYDLLMLLYVTSEPEHIIKDLLNYFSSADLEGFIEHLEEEYPHFDRRTDLKDM